MIFRNVTNLMLEHQVYSQKKFREERMIAFNGKCYYVDKKEKQFNVKNAMKHSHKDVQDVQVEKLTWKTYYDELFNQKLHRENSCVKNIENRHFTISLS